MKKLPDCDEILKHFRYSPDTGEFTPLGKNKAARVCSIGYVRMYISGKKLLAHRVAWKLVTGKDPDFDIDHINGDRSDNRIVNLRDISRAKNLQNIFKARKHNKSGVLGAGFCKYKKDKPFRARIIVDGKRIHLGWFETAEEAGEAYMEAKRRFHISQQAPP